jgi:uncharacterized protein (UPF0332 family)
VTPEAGEHLDKARECLARARVILNAGVGEDAGRDAYLAAFHAAQALIRDRRGRVAKTHRGVHRLLSELARNDPQRQDFALFLLQAYNLKAVADYELGPGAEIPLERAETAVKAAGQFVEFISRLMA